MRRLVSAALLACALVVSGGAAARREPPDYDGRGVAGDCIACIPPRIVLLPVRALYETLIRAPVGVVVRAIDARTHPDTATFGGVHPLFVVDVGFRARVGLSAEVRDQHTSFLALAEGGIGTYTLGLAPRRAIDDRRNISAYGIASRRPDAIYARTGGRVTLERGDAGVRADGRFGVLGIGASLGGRGVSAVDATYVASSERLEIVIDTTHEPHVDELLHPRIIRTDGVRLSTYGEHAGAFGPTRAWVSYGATLIGSLDTGLARILELTATVRFVDPIRGSALPWTELVPLGGDLLRGHLEGRFRGRSAFVGSVQWRYPIWTFLEGFLLGELGNTFDAHLEGFAAKRLRVSATAGMRHTSANGFVFELLSGVGTDTFEEHARVSSGRFLLAASMPLGP